MRRNNIRCFKVFLCAGMLLFMAGSIPHMEARASEAAEYVQAEMLEVDSGQAVAQETRNQKEQNLEKNEKDIPHILAYTGPVFTENEELYLPPEQMEQEGGTYRMVSVRLHNAKKKGISTYASTNISYALEGHQEPPETAVMTLMDENSGMEYEREVRRMDVTERDCVWRDDFSFPITVAGWDAEVFLLGDVEIPMDADWSSYGEEFLAYLGLPQDCYRIDRIQWDGDAYQQDGVLYRNAVASGEKLIRNVDVTYGGQVQTPDVPGKQYTAVYQAVDVETEDAQRDVESIAYSPVQEEMEEETAEESDLFQKIRRWMQEHITVVKVSVACLAVGIGCLILLWMKTRKDKKNETIKI